MNTSDYIQAPGDNGAVVLFSGGQDSTTCLALAIKRYGRLGVHALMFDYGQRQRIELQQAEVILEHFKIPAAHQMTLPVPILSSLGGAALTDPTIEVELQASAESKNVFAFEHNLPSTFVPGRNMLFLTLAAAYGAKWGIYNLITGVCGADRSGYPDCRSEFVEAAGQALSLALDEQVNVIAPLVNKTKEETWRIAAELRILETIILHTHTCYQGDRTHLHVWGYGCGRCPACKERARGFWASDKSHGGEFVDR